MSGVAPWERRDSETSKAFAWFVRYRDLPPAERSLNRLVSDALQPGDPRTGAGRLRQLARWSSQHDWVARAKAWDGEVDTTVRSALLADAERLARRQTLHLRVQTEALLPPAREIMERLADPERCDMAELEMRNMSMKELLHLHFQFAKVAPHMAEAERAAMRFAEQVEEAVTATAPEGVPVSGEALTPDRLLLILSHLETAGYDRSWAARAMGVAEP